MKASINLLVLLPAGALAFFLALHCLKTRRRNDAIVFLILAFPAFFIREMFTHEMYDVQGAARIGKAQLVPIVGWFFTVYNSLAISELLMARLFPKAYGRIFATAAVATLVTMGIADLVEPTGQAMGWWTATQAAIDRFPRDRFGEVWYTPAWMATAVLFLVPYLGGCALTPDVKPGQAMSGVVKRQIGKTVLLMVALFAFGPLVIGPATHFGIPILCYLAMLTPKLKQWTYPAPKLEPSANLISR